MSSEASPQLLKRILDKMKSIIQTRTAVLAILVIVAVALIGVAIAAGTLNSTPDIAGTWNFETEGTYTCGMPYDGWSVPVRQDGNTFLGNSRPEPVVKNGVLLDKNVSFSIVIENEDSLDGCGDFSELTGTLSGNTITGTIVGHDCANFCVWDGTFTVTIVK